MRPAVSCLLPALALACASAPAAEAEGSSPPTLEELHDCLVRHGVPPRLVKIERPAPPPWRVNPPQAGKLRRSPAGRRACPPRRALRTRALSLSKVPAVPAAEPVAPDARAPDLPRRLVFWTKTGEVTQTVIVAVIEGPPGPSGEEEERWVRIQSAGLARVPEGHPQLNKLAAYMLDRNFAMTGAQFARDAADGEVVLRADVPCARGIADEDFLQAVESVVRAAEDEAPRLAAVLAR